MICQLNTTNLLILDIFKHFQVSSHVVLTMCSIYTSTYVTCCHIVCFYGCINRSFGRKTQSDFRTRRLCRDHDCRVPGQQTIGDVAWKKWTRDSGQEMKTNTSHANGKWFKATYSSKILETKIHEVNIAKQWYTDAHFQQAWKPWNLSFPKTSPFPAVHVQVPHYFSAKDLCIEWINISKG